MNSEQTEKLKAALGVLEARARKLLEVAGIAVELVKTDEDCKNNDPCIELGNSGICVTITLDDVKTITGTIEKVQYGAYYLVYNPGVWRHPDGSGEPPSVDPEPLGEWCDSPDTPIVEAIQEYVKYQLNEFFTAESE